MLSYYNAGFEAYASKKRSPLTHLCFPFDNAVSVPFYNFRRSQHGSNTLSNSRSWVLAQFVGTKYRAITMVYFVVSLAKVSSNAPYRIQSAMPATWQHHPHFVTLRLLRAKSALLVVSSSALKKECAWKVCFPIYVLGLILT